MGVAVEGGHSLCIAQVLFQTDRSMGMKNTVILVVVSVLLAACGRGAGWLDGGSGEVASRKRIDPILAMYDESAAFASLQVSYPYEGAVFPPEIAAPVVRWTDDTVGVSLWLIEISFANDHRSFYSLVEQPLWEPDRFRWEEIKTKSVDVPATITVLGIGAGDKVLSRGEVNFSTASVGVEASILFRQVPLPFPVKNIRQIRWRLGDISSYGEPRTIMQDLPVCASCHVVSGDGRHLSMEMNYDNDSGAQFVVPVEKEIVLRRDDFFTWNDYPRSGILPKTRGLFARMSPGADYVLGSVNEISLALLTNDYRFSQVFFPTYGILAYYSVGEKSFHPLPGADDYEYVQTNPDWSPDEKYIVFARAPKKNEVHDDIRDVSPKQKDADVHELNRKYNIQFDLYRIPFDKGEGGKAEPLLGASDNGMSNYFPRHSPDGQWLVFTKSETGIMLQPDSELYIIPAAGGEARRMNCNRQLFNSWHSWSPNSRWLLFSSKVNTPFTEIFISYIDESGNDYPPVLLSRFSDLKFAANVPEFVNMPADAMVSIKVR